VGKRGDSLGYVTSAPEFWQFIELKLPRGHTATVVVNLSPHIVFGVEQPVARLFFQALSLHLAHKLFDRGTEVSLPLNYANDIGLFLELHLAFLLSKLPSALAWAAALEAGGNHLSKCLAYVARALIDVLGSLMR